MEISIDVEKVLKKYRTLIAVFYLYRTAYRYTEFKANFATKSEASTQTMGGHKIKEASSQIQITPNDVLTFRGQLQKNSAQFTLRNNSEKSICFKIKTSSPKEFLVTPFQGLVESLHEESVSVTFVGPPESKNKGQKFLIQLIFCHDVAMADWSSKDVREHRVGTKFVQDVEKEEAFNPAPPGRESIYNDAEGAKEDNSSLEEEKRKMTARNSELTSQIDRLKAEIGKQEHRLKFSKDVDVLTMDMAGKYGIPHLVLSLLLGIIIGYYILG